MRTYTYKRTRPWDGMVSIVRRRWLLVAAAGLLLVVVGGSLFSWALSREYPPEGSPDADLVAESTETTEGEQDDGIEAVPAASSGDEPRAEIRLKSLPADSLTGNFSQCADCHALLDHRIRNQEALTTAFAHGFHLEEGAICQDCHESPTHALTGTRRPPMDKCFEGCHSHEPGSRAPGDCAACHPADFPLVPESHSDHDWLPARERIDEVEGKHTSVTPDSLGECALCHGEQFCRDCHKMEMPHPGQWEDRHAETAREVGGSACVTCHPDRKSCADCHHSGYDTGGRPWVEAHYEAAAAEGVEKCIGCHSTKTCAHCHTTGEYLEYD